VVTNARTLGPWFRRHPAVARAVIIGLFVVITAVRFGVGGAQDATGLLFALPVTLAGFAFGQRAGMIAAGVAIAVILAWAVVEDVSLSWLGWSARVLPLALFGVVVGRATDQLRDAEEVKLLLTIAETHRRDAAEINDRILQRLVSSKWSLESGDPGPALEELEGAIDVATHLVSALLAGEPAPQRRRVKRPV
jgi:hypothetical protein